MRSRSVMVLMMATIRRRSPAAGAEDAAALLVDRDLHVVDLVVIHRHGFAEGAVSLDQRGNRLLQLLLDEAAHREHLAAHALQVFVETAGDVMTEVSGFHVRRAPAQGASGSLDHIRVDPRATSAGA